MVRRDTSKEDYRSTVYSSLHKPRKQQLTSYLMFFLVTQVLTPKIQSIFQKVTCFVGAFFVLSQITSSLGFWWNRTPAGRSYPPFQPPAVCAFFLENSDHISGRIGNMEEIQNSTWCVSMNIQRCQLSSQTMYFYKKYIYIYNLNNIYIIYDIYIWGIN